MNRKVRAGTISRGNHAIKLETSDAGRFVIAAITTGRFAAALVSRQFIKGARAVVVKASRRFSNCAGVTEATAIRGEYAI